MDTAPQDRCHALCGLAAVFTFAAICAGILFWFPPEKYSFYPSCPIHEYLHFECPGCGTTRALTALLHGHLAAAIGFNALAVFLVLPLVTFYAVAITCRTLSNAPSCLLPAVPRPAVYSALVIAATFTVLRNL